LELKIIIEHPILSRVRPIDALKHKIVTALRGNNMSGALATIPQGTV